MMMEPVTEARIVQLKSASPQTRAYWREVLEADNGAVRNVLNAATRYAEMNSLLGSWWTLPAWAIYHLAYRRAGRFIEESDDIAERLSFSPSALAFLQRAYTWAHAGCTAAIVSDGDKLWHLRSLDWGEEPGESDVGFVPAIAEATKRFDFTVEGKIVFQSAGITGMIGVLTGLKPRAFSIAINYAPWKTWSAHWRPDPTFLVRELLCNEKIKDYKQAFAAIRSWEPSSPVFISLCGIEPGQGAIIEFGDERLPAIRELGGNPFITQGNHFSEESGFKKQNRKRVDEPAPGKTWDDYPLERTSFKRCEILQTSLRERLKQGLPQGGMPQVFREAYSISPILNRETVQWTLMEPAGSYIAIWARQRSKSR
jgi:hypothetical protein